MAAILSRPQYVNMHDIGVVCQEYFEFNSTEWMGK